MSDDFGISELMRTRILAKQKQINKNLSMLLYGDDTERCQRPRQPTIKEWITDFFREAGTRISNAWDCLVHGIDPYDY